MPGEDDKKGLYGSENATGSWPLMEGAGQELHIDPATGRAMSVGSRSQPEAGGTASLSGPMKRYGKREDRPGMGGSDVRASAPKPKQRQYTHEELNRMADNMAAAMAAQHRAQLDMGPAVAPVDQGQPPAMQDAYAAQQAQRTNQFQMGPQPQQAPQQGPPPWLAQYMVQQNRGGQGG